MWELYLRVHPRKCSEALHISDRFHFVAKMNKALDEVRAEESRRMNVERLPVLNKSRWLLKQGEISQRSSAPGSPICSAITFQQLWQYNAATPAGKFLDE